MKRGLIIFIIVTSFSINVFGKITLPSIFADNMVLQQKSNVAIWGWAEPGETIKIVTSWNTIDTVVVKSNNYATWNTTIKTIGAGGPYSIEIIGSSYVRLKNVMLGEVWLCSGQSNMEWRAEYGITNKKKEVANAIYPNIRISNIQRMGAKYPQQDCFATWKECTPETMNSISAVAYFFARELHESLNVPIGIIVSAWGGTPAEVWIKENLVKNNSTFKGKTYKTRPEHNWPSEPGAAYNGMISPIVPFEIAGVLWYQGESNCSTYEVYSQLQKTLIENWRKDFKKDFPFYFVQIAPFDYGESINSAYLREQQEITTKIVPKTGMVVISDLVNDVKEIHPRNKIDVGKRLAAYALSETYKKKIGAYKSPMYKSMFVKKNKIYISIDNVINGLKFTKKMSSKFLIAGKEKKFIEAKAKIEGDRIVVYSNKIKNPLAVRFCFDNVSKPDVFSEEGLPLAPFRTDDW